jgi:hypothetical protein
MTNGCALLLKCNVRAFAEWASSKWMLEGAVDNNMKLNGRVFISFKELL